jgi:hypothetical protein
MAKEKKAKPPKVEKQKGRGSGGTLSEEELRKIVDRRKKDRPDPGVDDSEQTARDARLVDDAYDKDNDK